MPGALGVVRDARGRRRRVAREAYRRHGEAGRAAGGYAHDGAAVGVVGPARVVLYEIGRLARLGGDDGVQPALILAAEGQQQREVQLLLPCKGRLDGLLRVYLQVVGDEKQPVGQLRLLRGEAFKLGLIVEAALVHAHLRPYLAGQGLEGICKLRLHVFHVRAGEVREALREAPDEEERQEQYEREDYKPGAAAAPPAPVIPPRRRIVLGIVVVVTGHVLTSGQKSGHTDCGPPHVS